MARPLRADAERTVRAILDAADRVLAEDPTASLQQIADAAGVARTTVHRRFATREALVEAMTLDMLEQMEQAIDDSRPETAPPLIALHQLTRRCIELKSGWRFHDKTPTPEHDEIVARIKDKNHLLFSRLISSGAVTEGVDQLWVMRVYYGLLHEATTHRTELDRNLDELAEMVVTTMLNGLRPA